MDQSAISVLITWLGARSVSEQIHLISRLQSAVFATSFQFWGPDLSVSVMEGAYKGDLATEKGSGTTGEMKAKRGPSSSNLLRKLLKPTRTVPAAEEEQIPATKPVKEKVSKTSGEKSKSSSGVPIVVNYFPTGGRMNLSHL